MPITITLTEEDFLKYNNFSTTKNTDGSYAYRNIQNMWMACRNGFRAGVESTGKECEF